MKVFTMRISNELDAKLGKIATQNEISKSQVIRAALKQFTEKVKVDAPQN